MAPIVSFRRALIDFFIIMCTISQVPIIIGSLVVFTVLAIIFPSYYDLEPFIYVVDLLVSLLSLGFVVAEMVVLLRSDSDPPSRLFVFLQCIKNMIWIIFICSLGYFALLLLWSGHWHSDAWSCLGWTALGVLPFLASLLSALFDAVNRGVEMEENHADEQTPLFEDSGPRNSTLSNI